MHLKYSLSTTALLLAYLSPAQAEETFIQHEAHQHGKVEFNIAQDGKQILVEITAPGMDVVGFEHPANSADEKKVLAEKMALLKQADKLLAINAEAHCQLIQAEVDQEHEEDAHHDHAHHADEHKHDDHEDEHHDGEHQDEHAAFAIHYQYSCQQPEQLTSIDNYWFKHFPATQDIDVNLFTDAKQAGFELNPAQARISLQ